MPFRFPPFPHARCPSLNFLFIGILSFSGLNRFWPPGWFFEILPFCTPLLYLTRPFPLRFCTFVWIPPAPQLIRLGLFNLIWIKFFSPPGGLLLPYCCPFLFLWSQSPPVFYFFSLPFFLGFGFFRESFTGFLIGTESVNLTPPPPPTLYPLLWDLFSPKCL